MALANRIMGGGVSSGAAQAINGDVASGLTAAGSAQGSALTLSAGVNVIETAAASTGVILTDGQISDEYDILNLGANSVTVYPPSGGRINAIATNGGFTLATNTACKVKKFSATRWMAWLSA